MKYTIQILFFVTLLNIILSSSLLRTSLLLKPEEKDSLKSILAFLIIFVVKTIKTLYNKLLKWLVKSNKGHIQKIILNFGETDEERFMVANQNIDVIIYL